MLRSNLGLRDLASLSPFVLERTVGLLCFSVSQPWRCTGDGRRETQMEAFCLSQNGNNADEDELMMIDKDRLTADR